MKSSTILPLVALAASLMPCTVTAQDSLFSPSGQQIPGPACLSRSNPWEGPTIVCNSYTHEAWLKDIRHWRDERRIRIGYSDGRYAMPELAWTQSSFMQPQMMAQDRYFYDPVAGKYTVDRYLDDLEKRYGGIDAVLIWPTYPNMGIDDRNQHDLIRSMPGGVAGVRGMVADFHRRGVRVLFPMMMWDQGTHDPGKSWPDAIAELMKEIGADGINGDTQDGVPLAFVSASEAVQHPIVFQPEGSPHDEGLAWNLMTWGQYRFPFVPEVDRFKWLEPRHMVNISDRWNRSKSDDLQFAFFNGVGWESWENIWGIWNGITPRDAEATRRVATIERGIAPYLVSQDWEPLTPTLHFGIFASRWPLGENTVWTVINRNEYDVSGPQLALPVDSVMHYYDVYHGVELVPRQKGTQSILSFAMESYGFGAVLATRNKPDADVEKLLKQMKTMTAQPLYSYAREWKALPQKLVEIAATRPANDLPEGMVRIEGGEFEFKVEGTEIEGKDDIGVDVQYPWEDAARRYHVHTMQMRPYYMDKYPVTNLQFKQFLDVTHYHPKDDMNFLKDWKDGFYPAGWEKKPVTWVSIEDARAYAAWAGKRLPHDWEWQFAAQGTDGRTYPWGDTWLPAATPLPNRTRVLTAPEEVDAHPLGASASGVLDMVGNVWQWTDEYLDEHTRSAILRGGSYYQPQGSVWYFPQAYRNEEHSKLLLMAPGYDRSGTVGFRCVKDSSSP